MNIYTLTAAIASVLEDNSTLTDWVDTTYGHALKTYIGIDNRQPPGPDDCPHVILFPAGKIAGDGIEEKEYVVRVRVALVQEESTPAGLRITQDGITELDTMVGYVIDAIADGLDTIGVQWMGYESSFETVEHFPMFLCDLDFKFLEPLAVTNNVYN